MPESSVTAAGRSAPSPDGARSGITALRRGQIKTSRHSQRRAESGVSERRHGNGTLFDAPGSKAAGDQSPCPLLFLAGVPPRHSARTRRTRRSASNNRTRFRSLPPDAPAAFRRAVGRHVSSAHCTRLHGTKADLAESLRPSAAGPHGPQCVFPAVQTNPTAPQTAESGPLRAPASRGLFRFFLPFPGG